MCVCVCVYYKLPIVFYIFLRKPWQYIDIIFWLSKDGREFKKHCDYVHTISKDVILRRQKVLVNVLLMLFSCCMGVCLVGWLGGKGEYTLYTCVYDKEIVIEFIRKKAIILIYKEQLVRKIYDVKKLLIYILLWTWKEKKNKFWYIIFYNKWFVATHLLPGLRALPFKVTKKICLIHKVIHVDIRYMISNYSQVYCFIRTKCSNFH